MMLCNIRVAYLKGKREILALTRVCVGSWSGYSPAADAAVSGKAQNHGIYNQRYANHASDVTGPLEESLLCGVCGNL